MSLSQQLISQIQSTGGVSAANPQTAAVRDPSGLVLAVDLTAVERIGCSFTELRVQAPHLANATLDVLKKWGNALCQRITYLLENIGPLEFDTEGNEVLIRSMPPAPAGNSTKYYEVVLSSHGNGQFSLRRYETTRGQPGRQPVEIQATYEVLTKLVNDLTATLPAKP